MTEKVYFIGHASSSRINRGTIVNHVNESYSQRHMFHLKKKGALGNGKKHNK